MTPHFKAGPPLAPSRSETAALLLASLALVSADPLGGQSADDTLRVDSTHYARIYELTGIAVSVARPALTTGGSSAVEARFDSMPALPAPTMEEVLRGLPVLMIRRNSRGEAQPALRGSEERQLGILVDGIPISIGWDHRSDLSLVPLTAAQGIRVVRGMSSVLYGPNAIGGVLEVDVARSPRMAGSLRPIEIALSRDDSGGSGASLTFGRLFSGRGSELAVRAGVGFRDSPGIQVPTGASDDASLHGRYLADGDGLRLNTDQRRSDAFLALRLQTEDGAWTSLAVSGYDATRGVAPEAHQADPRLWRYPEQRRMVAAFSAGSGIVATPWGSGDVELSLGFDRGGSLIEAFRTETYSAVEATEEADGSTFTARLEADHSLAERGDLRTAFTYAVVGHDELLAPGGSNSYRQRLWSFAAETEWRLGRRGYTRVSVGGALDAADTPESGDKPPLGSLATYGVRVGASSLVASNLLVHAATSSRARFPSLRELYSGALGRFLPNPDLRPERLVGVEGGFTLHARGLELQSVAFHQRLLDGIVRRSVVAEEGASLLQRVNQDEVWSSGVEFLAAGRVGSVSVTGDLTLQHVRGVEENGDRIELEYEPAAFGRAGLEVPVGIGVRASAATRWVGRQSCQNPEVVGLQSVSASVTSDLALRRDFTTGGGALGRVQAVVALRNATDALAFDQCGLPQPGRTLEVHLQAR